MSKEIQLHYPTGATLYALLINTTGSVYNGSTFETFADANIGNYDIAMTEQGTASGFYAGNMPAVAAGLYQVAVRERAGASPAVSDPTVGMGEIVWDGSVVTVPPSAAQMADANWDEARSGHTTSGTFGESFNGVVSGQATTGTLSTTEMTTNLTETTDNHFRGRVVVWLTGALTGQAVAITSYVGSSKKLGFSAVTDTPAIGDRFVIV